MQDETNKEMEDGAEVGEDNTLADSEEEEAEVATK